MCTEFQCRNWGDCRQLSEENQSQTPNEMHHSVKCPCCCIFTVPCCIVWRELELEAFVFRGFLFRFFFFVILCLLLFSCYCWRIRPPGGTARRRTNYGMILMTWASQACFICMKPRTLCVWPDWETEDLKDGRNTEQLFCNLSVSVSTCDVWSLAESGRPTLTIPREY